MQRTVDTQAMSYFAQTIISSKYAHTKPSGQKETWPEVAYRTGHAVMDQYLPEIAPKVIEATTARQFMPGGRYLAAAGRRFPQCNNCFLFDLEDDSREAWASLTSRSVNALMTGGGIGVVYSKLRGENTPVGGLGGFSTGPISLMQMINECGRHIMQGGSRRSAIWAGLHWNHPDILKFIKIKNWRPELVALKAKDFSAAAPLDMTNISVILDDAFFDAYKNPANPQYILAQQVYSLVIEQMCRTGEPGFSIDTGKHAGEHLRNACTEVSSRTNNDMCNLASLNLARIHTKEEFAELIWNGVAFMLCGTKYSVLPIKEMYSIREINRRLGLGLMGIHEWLLMRGKRYGPDAELGSWLKVYADTTEAAAKYWTNKLGISMPVALRSIAPNGTIAIVAETTSGTEPIFATAQKRRYLTGKTWKAQYIIDACAQRLIDRGVDPHSIEDAYDLAEDVERRIAFQAWLQQYVDMGISSTINMPSWGSSLNNERTITKFGDTLMSYLPSLRGITVYPDGSRGGQPLNRVPYEEAQKYLGIEMVEEGESRQTEVEEFGNNRACVNGVCGV